MAPVVVGDTVMALLHGDRVHPRVDGPDLDAVRLLADTLGLVLEHVIFAEQLDRRRDLIVAALDESAGALTGYSTAPLGLSRSAGPVLSGYSATGPAASALGEHDSRSTGRQREVLDLVLTGATNSEIADRLTVAETTVKSYVRQILRKLGATNRAEAIARYLHTSGRPTHS